MKRSLNASSLVRVAVLMFEMLSETASSHLRWTSSPDPEMPRVSKTAMSARPQGRAQDAVLAVERVEGQLVAQPRLGGDDRLAVQVDVVPVRVGRLQRLRHGAAGDRRLLTVAERPGQGRLEVGAAGQEAGCVDVRDVVRGHARALGQAGEGGVQRRRGGVADHRTDRWEEQGTSDLLVRGRPSPTWAGSADPWRKGLLSVLLSHRHPEPRA